jgi:hypothetical protein
MILDDRRCRTASKFMRKKSAPAVREPKPQPEPDAPLTPEQVNTRAAIAAAFFPGSIDWEKKLNGISSEAPSTEDKKSSQ